MKKTTLEREDRKTNMKDDDSLPQKNVCLIMMTVSSIVVRLCEDNQLYMLPSICLLTIKKILHFFSHIHSCWTREKKKEKEKCLLYHPVEELKIFF